MTTHDTPHNKALELADRIANDENEHLPVSRSEIATLLRSQASDLADVVQELERYAAKLEYLLSGMFNQYENGTPCYDKPVEGIFIGYAMKLSDEDFDAIVNILNKCEDAAIAAREGGST